MDDDRPIPSYKIKSNRGNTLKYLYRKSNMNQGVSLKSDSCNSGTSLANSQSSGGLTRSSDKIFKKLVTESSGFPDTDTTRLPSLISSKKENSSNPLHLGYNANEELLKAYEEHSKLQENTVAKLASRIERKKQPSCVLVWLMHKLLYTRNADLWLLFTRTTTN